MSHKLIIVFNHKGYNSFLEEVKFSDDLMCEGYLGEAVMEDLKLSEEEINQLIRCLKEITAPPKKEMFLENGHWRNDIKTQSTDGAHDFLVFIRKNEDFEENFSIGSIYYPREIRGEIHLLRCNGPHGPHESFDHRDRFHIHKANPDNLASGVKAERTAYITK